MGCCFVVRSFSVPFLSFSFVLFLLQHIAFSRVTNPWLWAVGKWTNGDTSTTRSKRETRRRALPKSCSGWKWGCKCPAKPYQQPYENDRRRGCLVCFGTEYWYLASLIYNSLPFPSCPAAIAWINGIQKLRGILEGKESCQDAVSRVRDLFSGFFFVFFLSSLAFFSIVYGASPAHFQPPVNVRLSNVFRELQEYYQNTQALATEKLRAQTSCYCLGQEECLLRIRNLKFGYFPVPWPFDLDFFFLLFRLFFLCQPPTCARTCSSPWPESPRWASEGPSLFCVCYFVVKATVGSRFASFSHFFFSSAVRRNTV